MVRHAWQDLPARFPSVELDTFVIMPNHIHGIIIIMGASRPNVFVGARLALPKGGAASSAPTLGHIICAFKSISTIQVNRLLSRSGKRLWQRNYYEHIIRNEREFDRICRYIEENPREWGRDRENPMAQITEPDEPWQV